MYEHDAFAFKEVIFVRRRFRFVCQTKTWDERLIFAVGRAGISLCDLVRDAVDYRRASFRWPVAIVVIKSDDMQADELEFYAAEKITIATDDAFSLLEKVPL